MKNCPICQHKYTALSESESVCARHENWLVTRCVDCGVLCFSDTAGFCMRHGKLSDVSDFTPKGKPDPRFYLRAVGQEGYPVRGF